MTTPLVKVKEVQLFERKVKLRIPFWFGVATLHEAPQAFVRVRIELENGKDQWGFAAELMVPKWFDKNMDITNEDNFNQLRDAVRLASEGYLASPASTAFGLMRQNYEFQVQEGAANGLNPLAANFGPALLDRAVLDGVCRSAGISFYKGIQSNIAGIDPKGWLGDLSDFDMGAFLAGLTPSAQIYARHTIGMVDPLTPADQKPGSRIEDGLPETLEEVISLYGNCYFKVKVGDNIRSDIERLSRIASVLDGRLDDYKVTLDGNEQYTEADEVAALWAAMESEPTLTRFMNNILFIEQPLNRKVALERSVESLVSKRPIIVDESDEKIDSFLRAKEMGYSGVSSKTCKGFYKSILNAARCVAWQGSTTDPGYFLSAEDLTCQSGVAVQQDLALVSLLGLTHVERNGHHYVNGMAGAGVTEQKAFLQAHGDLYNMRSDRTCLKIDKGVLVIGSLDCVGFAVGAEPDWTTMEEVSLALRRKSQKG